MPTKLDEIHTWEELCKVVIKRLIKKFKNIKDMEKFQEWFLSREGVGYCFDHQLIWRCYRIWQVLRKDADHFICIVGGEGTGKSTIAIQIASWIQGTEFDENNICLTSREFFSIVKGDKYRSLILDEAALQLFSRQAMTGGNINLGKLFFIMRCYNLCTIACIPSLKFIDSFVREHRVKTLIIIEKRGRYKAVTGGGIPIVAEGIRKGKKINSVPIPYESFWQGDFRKSFPKNISYEAYEKRKQKGVDAFLQEIIDGDVEAKFIPISKVAKVLNCNRKTVIRMIQENKIEGKQQNKLWYVTVEAYQQLMTTDDTDMDTDTN